MKLMNIRPGIALLLFIAVSIPMYAGTVNFGATGTLGPLLDGIDPLGLNGDSFTLTGSINQNAVPISVSSDSATYNVPVDLNVIVGSLNLTGYYATLTLTDPLSGPDTMTLAFSVVNIPFDPEVTATLLLPDGTLHGTGIQNFSANVSQPDSNLFFQLIGTSQASSGTLGITGTTYIGSPPSGVPEPATVSLLAAGLVATFVLYRRRR